MTLLREWAEWNPGSAPYVLPADGPLLLSGRSAQATVVRRSWQAAYTADDFCAPGDTRLHLGLIPQPFLGNLERASIFLLLLNPGLGPDDYFGEYQVPGFRDALLANLRQDFSGRALPFLFLDPQFAWHGGFDWWHSKLTRVIQELAKTWQIPFSAARAQLARSVADIELFPYHSDIFHGAGGRLRSLASVQLARRYVHDVLLPRVRRKEAIIIVTRQARIWGLPPEAGVIVYSPGEARGAHLTPDSPGGRAILDHLIARGPA